MTKVMQAALVLEALALALVFHQTGVDGRLGAFAAGLFLFDLNLGLVVYVARRIFAVAGSAAPDANRKANPLLVGALFIKVMVLGVGAYVGLRVLALDPLFFVAGLTSALIFFAASATVLRRHFSLSRGVKVR